MEIKYIGNEWGFAQKWSYQYNNYGTKIKFCRENESCGICLSTVTQQIDQGRRESDGRKKKLLEYRHISALQEEENNNLIL